MPAGHATHAAADVEPGGERKPGGHGVGALLPAGQNVLAGQTTDAAGAAVVPSGVAQKEPAGQVGQVSCRTMCVPAATMYSTEQAPVVLAPPHQKEVPPSAIFVGLEMDATGAKPVAAPAAFTMVRVAPVAARRMRTFPAAPVSAQKMFPAASTAMSCGAFTSAEGPNAASVEPAAPVPTSVEATAVARFTARIRLFE